MHLMLLAADAIDTDRVLLSGHIVWLVGLALTALSTAATWAVAQLAKKLGAQGEATTKGLLLTQLGGFAAIVVQRLNATLVTQYKLAAADGRITRAEAEALAGAAIKELRDVLGTDGVARLKTVFGWSEVALDGQLRGVVEQKVVEAKVLAAQVPLKLSQQIAFGAVPHP
jgi:uncharacterized protein YdbL (DUF1318 family)